VKARGCAKGKPQQQYTQKEDSNSPTISLEAMIISCCINMKEGRYAMVTDITGAFLHADMNKTLHMMLEGALAEHIMKLEPTKYRKYIWHDKKYKFMLYVQLKKALCGMLQAAL